MNARDKSRLCAPCSTSLRKVKTLTDLHDLNGALDEEAVLEAEEAQPLHQRHSQLISLGDLC